MRQTCPACEKPLRVRHTYSVPGGSTQSAVCDPCDKIFTLVKVNISLGEEHRGKSAYTLAKKLNLETDQGGHALALRLLQNEGVEPAPDGGAGA